MGFYGGKKEGALIFPGTAPSTPNEIVHALYWATCHRTAPDDLKTEELAELAERFGYNLLAPEEALEVKEFEFGSPRHVLKW